jgi:hypothetical protein
MHGELEMLLQRGERRSSNSQEELGWGRETTTLSPRRIFQCRMSFSAAFHPIFLWVSRGSDRVWYALRRLAGVQEGAEWWRSEQKLGLALVGCDGE